MEFWSQWWVWGVLAVGLAVGEVLLPTYVLLGFSVGAGVIALLLLVGVPIAASLPVLVLAFAVVSVLSWIALRRVLGTHSAKAKSFDYDIND